MKLADIDGTTKGRAALVSMDLENPGHPMYEDFVEDDCCSDPIDRCWRLWKNIQDDFPGHTASVIANDRAKYLDYAWQMERLGVTPTPEKYLALGF